MIRDGKLVRKSTESFGDAVARDVVEQRGEGEHADADGGEHQRAEERRERAVASGGPGDAGPARRAGGDLGAGHSYTCLYLRTSRIETMFSISVNRNSVMPTTKIVSYSIEPVGMSPRAVAAMNAAIDW